MSDDIANILKRLAVIESDITPVGVKKGLNKQHITGLGQQQSKETLG